MHYGIRLGALVPTALTALALVATPAFGQATVALADEATGSPCPAVSISGHGVTGGCYLHIVSEAQILMNYHTFGIENLDYECGHEFDMRLNENGEGYAYNQLIGSSGSGSCPRRACTEAGGAAIPWTVHAEEATGSAFMELRLCIEDTSDGTNDTTCHLVLPLLEPTAHAFEFSDGTEVACQDTNSEFQGHWVAETTNVEAIH